MGSVDSQVTVPTIVNSNNSEPHVRKPKRRPKTHLHINAWRLIDSEFDFFNAIFYFNLEACCDPAGSNRHGSLPFYYEKDSFLSYEIAGQSVYCNPPWSLVVQCVEHIRTWHAKSPMNTKVVIILQDWPQFNAATSGLKLLRQVQTNTPVFTKPSPLGKVHSLVKVSWPINYWVIDKYTSLKATPTPLKSVVPICEIDNTNSKSDIVAHWLPTVALLTIMDPNQ